MAATAITESSVLLPCRVPSSRNGYGQPQPNGQRLTNGHVHGPKQPTAQQHIVHIGKEQTDAYEPIFGCDDYTCGLALEELLPYLDDPWWQRLRQFLFGAFWLVFVLVLMTACALAVLQHDLPCNVVSLAPNNSPMVSDAPSRTAMTTP